MTTKEFIERLNKDAEENNNQIFEKIQEAGKNPEAVYAIAKEAGLTDSFEDFQAEMKKMYDSMTEEGLSEEELLAIAGGLETEEKLVIGIGTGVGVVVTGAAFAAAV